MSLEDLTRYEFAAVSATNVKEKPNIALASIGNFYEKYIIPEVTDPVYSEAIKRSLKNASIGVDKGLGLSDSVLIESIMIHAKKYEDAYKKATIGELVEYFGEGYKIPETVILGLSQYQDNLFSDVKDDSAKKSIELLKTRRILTLGLNMETKAINEGITQQLLELYPEQKGEE